MFMLLFVYFSFEASVMVGGGKNLMNDFDAAVRQTLALAK